MRTVISPLPHDPNKSAGLVEYLHGVREADRTSLARELHDDVGAMLVAAAMELGWVEAHSQVPELNEPLQRLGSHLADIIKINRRSIERLRPTLLEAFGLFEALRWCFRLACQEHPVQCEVALPEAESRLLPHELTHLFRATQTLLECTLLEGDLERLELEAWVIADVLAIRLRHRHAGSEPANVLSRFEHELGSAAHRVAALGGELVFDATAHGATYSIHVPLAGDRRQ